MTAEVPASLSITRQLDFPIERETLLGCIMLRGLNGNHDVAQMLPFIIINILNLRRLLLIGEGKDIRGFIDATVIPVQFTHPPISDKRDRQGRFQTIDAVQHRPRKARKRRSIDAMRSLPVDELDFTRHGVV